MGHANSNPIKNQTAAPVEFIILLHPPSGIIFIFKFLGTAFAYISPKRLTPHIDKATNNIIINIVIIVSTLP